MFWRIDCCSLIAYIAQFPKVISTPKFLEEALMSESVSITVAHGDGIGPEIMAATLHILKAASAPLKIETIDIGEKVYLAGNSAGIEEVRA